jgi:hypothetical protein
LEIADRISVLRGMRSKKRSTPGSKRERSPTTKASIKMNCRS